MLTADDVQKWLEEVRARPGEAQGAAAPEPGKDRARSSVALAGSDGSSPGGRGATVLVLRDPVRAPGSERVLAAMSAAAPERQRSWALSLAIGLLSGLALGVGVVGLVGFAPSWLTSTLEAEDSPAGGEDPGATVAVARPPAAEPAPAEASPPEPARLEPARPEPAPAAPVTLESAPVAPGPPAPAAPEPAAPEPARAGPTASDEIPPEPRLVDPPRNDPRAVLAQVDRRPLRRRAAPLDLPGPDDDPAVLTASAPLAATLWRPSPLPAPEAGAPIRLAASASPGVARIGPVPALLAPPTPDRPPSPEASDPAVAAVVTPAAPRLRVDLHLPPALPQTAIYDAQAAVTEAGFDLSGTSIARFGVAESEVRFFHREDAAEAARIADRMGAEARDFSAYRPVPPLGTLEVWLAQEG